MEDSAPQFQLRVLQGQTEFPERPLTGDRFLIGGGSQCQLQLGGDTPMVHSLLTQHEDGWQIEALAPWPLLMVNHQQVRRLVLRLDDVLEIGEFRFRMERQVVEVVLPEPLPASEAEPVPVVDDVAPDPSKLAAAEIAERLESALEELGQRESRRRAGWNNLLSAAFAATPAHVDSKPAVTEKAEAPVAPQPAPWAHIEVALAELTSRMKALDERETALIENAHLLEAQQSELLACLDAIRAELNGQANNGPAPHLKISA